MDALYDNFIGPFIFISLIFGLLLAFILPKTRLSSYFKVSERYFVLTNICGMLCGALGIVAIFMFPAEAVKAYWWKIIILPFVFMEIYLLFPMLAKKTTKIFDEKQEFNMGTAGGITLGITILFMGIIVEPIIQSGALEILLLFPFYINLVILTFSFITLVLFKTA